MKRISLIFLTTFIFTILFSLIADKSLAGNTWSTAYFSTACYSSVGNDPCSWGLFDTNCKLDVKGWCSIGIGCNRKSGNQCYASGNYGGPFTSCKNTNDWHSPDGSTIVNNYSCEFYDYGGFQFYTPPTPIPPPTI